MSEKRSADDRKEIEHYNAILLEDMRSQFRLVIEKVDSSEERLGKRIDDFKEEVNERFDILETVVRGHSVDIKEMKGDIKILKSDVGTLKSDVSSIRSDMKSMERRLSDKIDGVIKTTDNHETRITVL